MHCTAILVKSQLPHVEFVIAGSASKLNAMMISCLSHVSNLLYDGKAIYRPFQAWLGSLDGNVRYRDRHSLRRSNAPFKESENQPVASH